jgi:hypothetical protein
MGRAVVDRWDVFYATDEISYCKIVLYFGNATYYREYQEVARPAAHVLLSVMGGLTPSQSNERLRETVGEFCISEGHLLRLGGSDDVTLWSLAVQDLIDSADEGSGTLMERVIRPDGSGAFPEAPWDLSGTSEAEATAVERYGTVLFAPIGNLLVCSIIAIDKPLNELGSCHDNELDSCRDDEGLTPENGYLGLILDYKNRRVTRIGYGREVEFGGKALSWALLCELHKK